VSSWDPAQYNRFAAEREQPFWDLAALLRPVERPRLVDLGCGDGRLTTLLADRLQAGSARGLDHSPTMLGAATTTAATTFAEADIATWTDDATLDIVFSNAALQWVPDHAAVIARWARALEPGGQLAIQMPANGDHPSHTISRQLAEEMIADPPPDSWVNVETLEFYSQTLFDLGFAEQHVRQQIYGHILDSSEAVIEWVKGTTLTRIRAVLDASRYDEYLDEYGRRLLAELGDQRPYFYPFKRILIWGRLPV
jgi:trans-aconitate 2-methyltransferase